MSNTVQAIGLPFPPAAIRALLMALLGLILLGSSLRGAQASEPTVVNTPTIEAASKKTASTENRGGIAISIAKLPQATMIAPQPKLSPLPV